MNEKFSTPNCPDDLVVECDGCQNFIYVRGESKGAVSPCPICGCLNKLAMIEIEKVKGQLILRSGSMVMNKDSLEQGRISLPGLPEKVQESLIWLQQNEWTFGFTIDEEDNSGK